MSTAAAVGLWAQSPLGTITGTVVDGTGSRAPGVEVTATQVDTNLTFKAKSSEDGTYVVPNLPVGRYSLTAVSQGFKTFKRSDLVLEVSQRLRVDITLELGAITESVTVSGEPPRVQTEESALGTSVERQRIEQLPMNGRNVFSLARLVAGVQPRSYYEQGFADAGNQGFSQIRFNGGPVYGNQIFLDGGANTAPVHGEVSVVPMADAVEEFRVETNALKAEHGQNNGGVINVVTKSGTNAFHGTLYEFFRNDALDARNAFVTQPDSSGRLKPILRYNQYGGTVGGPVWIPKVYDGKNRTFFFLGYEQYKYRNAAIRRGTVPTALERAGDFSLTRDGTGARIPIYDPSTTRANPAGSGFVRDLMPGNIVPKARIDALALRVQEYMPLPNQTPNNQFTNSEQLPVAGDLWPGSEHHEHPAGPPVLRQGFRIRPLLGHQERPRRAGLGDGRRRLRHVCPTGPAGQLQRNRHVDAYGDAEHHQRVQGQRHAPESDLRAPKLRRQLAGEAGFPIDHSPNDVPGCQHRRDGHSGQDGPDISFGRPRTAHRSVRRQCESDQGQAPDQNGS